MKGMTANSLALPAAAEAMPRLRAVEPPESVSDAALMRSIQQGDSEAFCQLVDRYKDSLVNYLTRMTRCRDRAEDYAQETFVRIFRTADRYQEQGQLSGYLFRIATNLLRSDERRAGRWRGLSPLYAASRSDKEPSAQERRLLSEEATDRVTRALAALPLLYRAPLVLREIEGWSYAQIAEAIGCREGTVKSRINRGKARLRVQLESYWQGEES